MKSLSHSLGLIVALSFAGFFSCKEKEISIERSVYGEIIVNRLTEENASADVLFVRSTALGKDTLTYSVTLTKDTIDFLECDLAYACFYRIGSDDYTFIDSVKFHGRYCERDVEFEQSAMNHAKLNFLVQDFKKGFTYQLGTHGKLVSELDSLTGFIRGFDLKDSLLAWCSDSSAITIKNLHSGIKRVIRFEPEIKIHHDLIIHYPFVSALYNRKNYRTFNKFKVIEEGFVTIDLRSKQMTWWSIHDFLTDKNLPLRNAKGAFVTAHGNSIDVDKNGDYYISFRDFNQVWKISHDLKNVHYRIGLDAPEFKLQGKPFVGQHSIDLFREDEFYLFDNGSTGFDKGAKSRIVKVSVSIANKSVEVKNILGLPDSLSTIRMGSVHAMGDRLVVSTFNNGFHLLEIDTTGKVNNHLTSMTSHAMKVLPVRNH